MGELKSCPWCGGKPTFYGPEWDDDNRYVRMELGCCAKMTDSLTWSQARGITPNLVKETLTQTLTAIWNDRYEPDIEDLHVIEPEVAPPPPSTSRF